jgi:hypothetical protein
VPEGDVGHDQREAAALVERRQDLGLLQGHRRVQRAAPQEEDAAQETQRFRRFRVRLRHLQEEGLRLLVVARPQRLGDAGAPSVHDPGRRQVPVDHGQLLGVPGGKLQLVLADGGAPAILRD